MISAEQAQAPLHPSALTVSVIRNRVALQIVASATEIEPCRPADTFLDVLVSFSISEMGRFPEKRGVDREDY
jgi:hypothetical protein